MRFLHVTANALTACVCDKEAANVPFAVLHFTANTFVTARVCGREAANVPFAVLRVKANIFYYRAFAARKRRTCRLRFLHVTANAFVTARLRQRRSKRAVCGFARYGECFCYRAFAVLHFTANALTARVCGKGAENVPFAVCALRRIFFITACVCDKSGKRTVIGII